jgi:hypothetical protein
MQQRGIAEEEIRQVLRDGTRIRDYPDDRPHPSYLMLGWIDQRPLHVVASDDPDAEVTILITAYEPDPMRWDSTFTRRTS